VETQTRAQKKKKKKKSCAKKPKTIENGLNK